MENLEDKTEIGTAAGTVGLLTGIVAGAVVANTYIANSDVTKIVPNIEGQIYLGSTFAFGLAFAAAFSSAWRWYAMRQMKKIMQTDASALLIETDRVTCLLYKNNKRLRKI